MSTEARELAVTDRLPGVDALRGLAAMLVVLHHIHIRFRINGYTVPPFLPEGVAKVLFWTGYYSVICFFVISGFLITRLSLRRWGDLERVSPAAFYGLRAARILPCLLLVLAATSLLHLAGVRPFVIRPEVASLGRALIAALGFHVNWYEAQHGYLPGTWDVMWSLSIEETFYLVFPLACLALRSRAAMLFGLVPLIVVAPFYRVAIQDLDPWDEFAYLACVDCIAIGCIVGWLSERRPLNPRSARIAMTFGVAAMLLILVFRRTATVLGLVATGTYITVLAMGMALVLLAMAAGVGSDFFHRHLSWLRAVGRSSYELYLTHMFVVYGFFLGFMGYFGKNVPHAWIYPVSYVVMLVLSVLLGRVVSRWFSEPANRRLRAWMKGIAVRYLSAAAVTQGERAGTRVG
ncbi:MAG TPA: acyltransferase [Steroidobacteraceae bacterium]